MFEVLPIQEAALQTNSISRIPRPASGRPGEPGILRIQGVHIEQVVMEQPFHKSIGPLTHPQPPSSSAILVLTHPHSQPSSCSAILVLTHPHHWPSSSSACLILCHPHPRPLPSSSPAIPVLSHPHPHASSSTPILVLSHPHP